MAQGRGFAVYSAQEKGAAAVALAELYKLHQYERLKCQLLSHSKHGATLTRLDSARPVSDHSGIFKDAKEIISMTVVVSEAMEAVRPSPSDGHR